MCDLGAGSIGHGQRSPLWRPGYGVDSATRQIDTGKRVVWFAQLFGEQRMAYLRRHPRSAFECPLILDIPPHPGVPGEACDLGVSGIGLIVSTRVPKGSQVSILLDPDVAPDPLADLTRLVGTVAYARSEGYTPNGMQLFRIGIRFFQLSEQTRTRIHQVVSDLVTRRSAGEPDRALSLKADGRELLYQTAFEHLDRRRFVLARDLAILALRGDPHNVHFRALVHRVNAEEALAQGRADAARREAACALRLLPDEPDIEDLATRCDAHPKEEVGALKRFWIRLRTPHGTEN